MIHSTCSNILSDNLSWLKESIPSLHNAINDNNVIQKVSLLLDDRSQDLNLFFDNELVLESCVPSLETILQGQLSRTDGVAMPRTLRSQEPPDGSLRNHILAEMINAHHEVFLDYLPSIPSSQSLINDEKPPYKNLIIFGSLMLLPLYNYLQGLSQAAQSEVSWVSITLVEDDLRQLYAVMALLPLPQLIKLCKENNINLVLHVDQSQSNLQDRIYTQISLQNPTLLYGWQTLRSPVRSPGLMELHSWLHSPEGAAQHMLGLLGFATDEINQTQQALWNALSHEPMNIIRHTPLLKDVPVVLVASGPSLMDQLDWLKENQVNLNIVAAGSSLGALIKANIRPDVVVFLERDADVYNVLCDLLAEGFSLEDITAYVSSTIDPRVPLLFNEAVFFHRPVAAATGLFPSDQCATLPISGPHVINAALEVLLILGVQEVLLIGADFSALKREIPRAQGALGYSPRNFAIPVLGNNARTVFSEAGLLHTAYLLNRIVASAPELQVVRIGEGIVLDSIKTIEYSPELMVQFGRAPLGLKSVSTLMPESSFSKTDCLQFIEAVSHELPSRFSDLECSIKNAQGWSRSLVDKVSYHLIRKNEKMSRQSTFLSNLLCQPLFFVLMTIHDADNTNEQDFPSAKDNALISVSIIEDVVLRWLLVMKSWLLIKQLPPWNPEWLKNNYLRS